MVHSFEEGSTPGRSRAQSQFGTNSNSRSFDVESWSYIKHKDYNLQLMQKVKTLSTRTMIPTNIQERMAFYRSYTTSGYKTHINSMQDLDIRYYVWYYLLNVIFKALPSVYTQMFLSNYATDDHMYMSKMFPIVYGADFIWMFTAFCELQLGIIYLTRYMVTISYGAYKKMPWLTCSTKLAPGYLCLSPEKYRAYMENATKKFNRPLYHTLDTSIAIRDHQGKIIKKVFMSPILFSRQMQDKMKDFESGTSNEVQIYVAVLWIAILLCYGKTFKRKLWTILYKIQWILIFIFLITLAHIAYMYLDKTSLKPIPAKYDPQYARYRSYYMLFDVDYLAESMIAPPLIHYLRGRSHDPVNPSTDGGAVVLSNALYSLLRGFVTRGLRYFCQNQFGTSIHLNVYDNSLWNFLWPVYFSVYPMGGFVALCFFILHFIDDFLTFIILFYCTLDIFVSEWPKIKTWIYLLIFVALSLLYFYLNFGLIKKDLFIVTKAISTCLDCVVVFWLYPVGRLVDDITFNYGYTPSTLRIWSLKLTPLYYLIKTSIFFKAYYDLYRNKIISFESLKAYWLFIGSCVLLPVMFIVGTIYAIIKYLCLKKENWRSLFRPVPRWGPPDHIQRQLRKQFDSRVYIKSQSSRYQSRHQLSKEEDTFYKLDICYERLGRRSTNIQDNIKFANEKKNV